MLIEILIILGICVLGLILLPYIFVIASILVLIGIMVIDQLTRPFINLYKKVKRK